ncbi:MAG: DNA repair protein RadA [Patescibacteria group bacterium]|nr:DNA repair protein RadA [Patescibacteria group bacterium]
MSGAKNIYICSNCDAQFLKWSGRCLECGAWGTLSMKTVDEKEAKNKTVAPAPAEVINLGKIKTENLSRLKVNISEVDRVLGGGLVAGSLILLSGEPGIGKSTIVAQIACALTGAKNEVIYVSGEESAGQIKDRFLRLGCDLNKIKFVSETNTEKIISTLNKEKPVLVIVDSIQTVYSSEIPSEAGSVAQIRASAVKFLEIAKRENIVIILIGHITKDGQVAGPKTLEHVVDTVIYLESEAAHNYRILRATKNRFGSVNELGIFEMTAGGFKEILNPSLVFIADSGQEISGSVISCVMEGTRPFLVELQALVTKTVFGYPQRKSSGFDLNRLQVLAAVLTKRTKINLTNQDIILNVVGGLSVGDPGLDLAVSLAIISSLLNQNIDKKMIALGEIGLGGEIRNVAKLEERLREAEKLGFTKAMIPDCAVKARKLELIKVKNLEDVVSHITYNT